MLGDESKPLLHQNAISLNDNVVCSGESNDGGMGCVDVRVELNLWDGVLSRVLNICCWGTDLVDHRLDFGRCKKDGEVFNVKVAHSDAPEYKITLEEENTRGRGTSVLGQPESLKSLHLFPRSRDIWKGNLMIV